MQFEISRSASKMARVKVSPSSLLAALLVARKLAITTEKSSGSAGRHETETCPCPVLAAAGCWLLINSNEVGGKQSGPGRHDGHDWGAT